MRELNRLRDLPPETPFVTALTRRIGLYFGSNGSEAVVRFADGEVRRLHPDVAVEVSQ